MNKLLLIGDAMIDRNIYLSNPKKSAEVEIKYYKKEEINMSLGGAANVLQSLSSFYPKNKIDFAFQIGTSVKYKNFLKTKLIKLCKPIFFYSKKTKTTIKTRYYFNDKQIFRIDDESIKNNLFLKKIKSFINLNISKYNKVIVSDYNKGFVTKELLQYLSELKKKYKFQILVDTKKNDLRLFRNFDYIKQNYKEYKSLGINKTELKSYLKKYNIQNYLLTKSEQGMDIFSDKNFFSEKNLFKVNANNVSGAGDTILSSLVILDSIIKNKKKMINILNLVGKIVVSSKDICKINKKFIFNLLFLKKMGFSDFFIYKFFVKQKKIGFTNGCFDILHKGHLSLLQKAKANCDLLFIGLNSDNSIKKIKGINRPYNSLDIRKKNLNKKKFNYLLEFNEKTPLRLINEIIPDLLIKGSDYKNKKVVGRKLVEKYGGRVYLHKFLNGYSTTKILKKIKYE